MTPLRRVIIESPYAGDPGHVDYARRALADSLARGEAPIASHLLHTQVLDDDKADERARGIAAGLAWVGVADAVVLYVDRGISEGMLEGLDAALRHGVPAVGRRLDGPAIDGYEVLL